MTELVTSTKRFAPARLWIAICLVFLTVCSSCSSDTEQDETAGLSEQSRHCLECHDVTLDTDHRIDCETCHQLVENNEGSVEDHPSIIAMPAHPDNADRTCGQCHAEQSAMVLHNDHYQLTGHIETIRAAFAVESDSVKSPDNLLLSVSAQQIPETTAHLVDDLLSRRCLRCHVYSSGDPFDRVAHGTGCAACHLEFSETKMATHRFIAKPSDDRCLSCHYGNHVGSDYYGRYEHDLNEEYRTPYFANNTGKPPYGVEYHQLTADVHQAAGMVCIDCHTQQEVMGSEAAPSCNDCHNVQEDRPTPLPVSSKEGKTYFTSAATGKTHLVPQLTDAAHVQYGDRFSCQVCHAQWSFNDGSIHLLRIDHEEFDNFYKLSVDGSYEVQRIIESHIREDGDLYEPFMTDKFSGESLPGIWFRGFIERRWERMEFVEDKGRIHVARPILDMYLSWIDYDEQTRFDNIRPELPALRSYAPHTIGKADLFYQTRIEPYLVR